MYPLVLQIYDRIRLLPHTSADCERAFSDVNNNKTKLQNALDNESLCGILHSKQILKVSKNESCFDYSVPKNMLQMLNTSIK